VDRAGSEFRLFAVQTIGRVRFLQKGRGTKPITEGRKKKTLEEKEEKRRIDGLLTESPVEKGKRNGGRRALFSPVKANMKKKRRNLLKKKKEGMDHGGTCSGH